MIKMYGKKYATAIPLYPNDEEYFKGKFDEIPEELINQRKKHIKTFLRKNGYDFSDND